MSRRGPTEPTPALRWAAWSDPKAAMISAGNTGATMAAALLRMGRIRGVSRPAIATPIPVPGQTPTVLLDAGANAECQAACTEAPTLQVNYRHRYRVTPDQFDQLIDDLAAGRLDAVAWPVGEP